MEYWEKSVERVDEPEPQESEQERNYARWLGMARDAYDESTSYVDNNYRSQWENNLRHWQGRHHQDSKYYSDSYKYRSKIFRPKTRSSIRNNEAAAVAAFFSNQDVLNVEPLNQTDPYQKASADIMKELMQYRLTKTIPWFKICIGGFQDAMVTGVVASYQYWEYEAEPPEPAILGGAFYELDEETGEYNEGFIPPQPEKRKPPKKDRPCIKLIPVENVRIHPGSDWANPVESSPYLIIRWPMFVCDVKQKMEDLDDKTGLPKWKRISDADIKASVEDSYDSTRSTRDENRTDSLQQSTTASLSDFQVVWCHENFIKDGGQDYVYWTLGTDQMLTDPKPLEEVYFHGERPVVIGNCIVEAHKAFPSGLGQLGENVQKELNEIANQRLDNVKLVLNKRWLARRGANVDLLSITRNVAGSITLADNLDDVREVEFNDVTGSSYQEQDRLNVDYDELVGTFSASTLQTNRKLNETVGGMAMLRGGVNSLVEYVIRTFTETWVEPVLRQIVKLEQAYESDMVVLSLAAEKAKLFQKYGINMITDDLLNQELTLVVNVGMGATDPLTKMNNFSQAVMLLNNVMSGPAAAMLELGEVAKEAFGRVGYKDGGRFIKQAIRETPPPGQEQQPDPEKVQMAQILQQMQAQLQDMSKQLADKSAAIQSKERIALMKEQNENARFTTELQADFDMKRLDLHGQRMLEAERMIGQQYANRNQ